MIRVLLYISVLDLLLQLQLVKNIKNNLWALSSLIHIIETSIIINSLYIIVSEMALLFDKY